MNNHRLTIVGALLLASSLHGQTKPVDQATVGFYLDRARIEIAQWQGPDADYFAQIPSMHDVGTLLLYARGNEQDRQIAKRLFDMPMKFPDKMTAENRELSTLCTQLVLRAALGEGELLIKDVQAVLDGEKPVFPGWPSSSVMLWGLLGERDRCLAGVRPENASTIASMLFEAGRDEIAQAVLDLDKKQYRLKPQDGWNARYLELAYARGGLRAAEEELKNYERIDHRIRAIEQVALLLAESNKHDDARALLHRALEDWRSLKKNDYPAFSRTNELCDAGFVDYAQKAFDFHNAHAAMGDRQNGWWYWSDVARSAAVLSRPKQLEEASRELRKIAEISDPERPEDQVDAGYALAAALILKGERAAAMEAFASTRTLAPDASLDVSESFWRIADAMHRIGDHRAAIDLQKKHLTADEVGDLDFELGRYVEHLIREKQYEVAWKGCDGFERLWNLRQIRRLSIVLHLIRAGREARALELIESLASPTERASLYLLIARDLTGTRLLGTARISYE